jgi:hypothetical protein
VDALVVDEQRARLWLVEHVQRVEVVADRLVAEPTPLEVDEDSVLRVIEGQIRELVRIVVGDLRGDQVSVEAGPVRAECSPHRTPKPQAVAHAVRVRPQR